MILTVGRTAEFEAREMLTKTPVFHRTLTSEEVPATIDKIDVAPLEVADASRST